MLPTTSSNPGEMSSLTPDLTAITWYALYALSAYVLGVIAYRRYFHPLAQHPGPFWWTVSRLPWVYHQVSGNLPHRVHEIHCRYGQVVRTAPDELSFIKPEAWRDIYGPHRATVFKKDMKVYPKMVDGVDSILTADNANHPRHRKLLNHAFGDRALREQEPVFTKYVDQLIRKLKEKAQGSSPNVDLVKWYNWTTFDIVGHLGFGEPFGCLEDEAYHPWVALIFQQIKGGAYISASKRFPPLNHLLRLLIPKSLMAKRAAHLALTRDKVDRRIRTGSRDPDFLSFVLKENSSENSNEGGSLSRPEIELDSAILIIAGSETTATTLSGTTYYLSKTPRALRALQDEIRAAFPSESDITLLALQKLEYLNAVLQEGLRLYPPIPMGLARVLEGSRHGGEVVAGTFVPEGSRASVAQYGAYRSPTNFVDADCFHPERWLASAEFATDRRDVVQSFSVGPRNCIGIGMGWAELRLILARVIWNFDLALLDSDDAFAPEQQLAWNLWSKPALNVKIRVRQQQVRD